MNQNELIVDSESSFSATVVFTTINREQDLRKAIQSALEQVPPLEVIVIGDGSPEEIIDMVAGEFPTVRLYHTNETMGISVQRNWGARLATTPYIISIDDDATFTSPDTVRKTLEAFRNPLVGAVAMPFIDVFRDREHGLDIPADEMYVDYHFIGTAYALRKDLFLQLEGFDEQLMFQGEEDDYCARLLNAGYVIACGNSAPIHHFVSPIRSWERIAYLSARNSVLYAYTNVPKPYLSLHMLGTTVMNLLNGMKKKMFINTVKGLFRGYLDCFSSGVQRRPVTVNTYKLIRKLRKGGAAKLASVQSLLNARRAG